MLSWNLKQTNQTHMLQMIVLTNDHQCSCSRLKEWETGIRLSKGKFE
jgi:hypothetical protein